MRVAASQAVTIDFRVKDADGALVDADSTPTAVLYRNGVATAVSVSPASITGTGKYNAPFTVGAYSSGDQLRLEVTATVSGTSYTATVWEATVDVAQPTTAEIASASQAAIEAAHGTGAYTTPDSETLATAFVSELTASQLSAAVTVSQGYDAGRFTVTRGTTLSLAFSNLGPYGSWDKIYFTIRKQPGDSGDPVFSILKTNGGDAGDGLQIPSGDASGGSIDPGNETTGSPTVTISATQSQALRAGQTYYYDAKLIKSGGTVEMLLAKNEIGVLQDVTREIA